MTERTETGGPNRTPRSEIAPVIPAARRESVGVEPVLYWDISGSTLWEAAPGQPEWSTATRTGGRREIMTEVARTVVAHLESLDTEAAKEQASGSDEMGGLLTFFFGSDSTEGIDLNSSNFDRKVNGVTWGGATHISRAWEQALNEYEEEFGDRPAHEQPVHTNIILTDGELDDMADFGKILQGANAHRVFLVAIFGYDEDPQNPRHTQCLKQYTEIANMQKAADPHGKSYIYVVSFDQVTDPNEIATDVKTMLS